MKQVFTEDAAVEQPAIALLHELGWQTYDAYHEFDAGASPLGRDSMGEVVLIARLRPALQRLNPALPAEALELAIQELTRDRSAMSLAAANREVYALLKRGVKVTYRPRDDGDECSESVRVVDWNEPVANDWLLVSQFWVTGEMYTRRADLVGFVNGLPLLLIELKAAHKVLKNAFDKNLRDYKSTIPQLSWYNALIILSNGSQSRLGSVTAAWEHLAEWKKINDEGEHGRVSLETRLRGTCDPPRLLDLAENFTLFQESRGGWVKLIAKNHQYLGVNNVVRALLDPRRRRAGLGAVGPSRRGPARLGAVGPSRRGPARLGVFWHTQGSGKSVSMIVFAQKVLGKVAGNWTFLVVTDRQELDDQIYKNFLDAGVVTEEHAQASSGEHLKCLLREDHRYIFSLIHKFHTPPGTRYPKLTDRSDIIVITDEAHRSQYDTLALNMRNALPNAAFIAFTGTPLIVSEEKTKQVFGDYVSVYNFKQSVDDGATVPLYYENRIPELQLTNENLNEDMQRLLEEAELDPAQEARLEREFAHEYQLITRDECLEAIAADLVEHFLGRGFRGKAMVVSIDKATAVRTYDKVQAHWKARLERLRRELKTAAPLRQEELQAQIDYMQQTDMAVVVSQGQNEVEDLARKGADIVPHRRRMLREDLDGKFKDPDDPFRIVFVCAMWMTGFDVPCCSTIYLDKPMRNHTLMQTIARANRVFGDKVNGLIVDYVGVFRNLQRALAIYGSGVGGALEPGEMPLQPKAALLERLQGVLAEARTFCAERGVRLDALPDPAAFGSVRFQDDAVEAIIATDESKARFAELAAEAERLYRAVLPDLQANVVAAPCAVLRVLAEKVRSLTPPSDISGVMGQVEQLLDESVALKGYVIRGGESPLGEGRVVDLSQIDFDALAKRFVQGHKRMQAEKLRGAVHAKLLRLVRLNRTRMDYLQRFQQLIDEYNSGSLNVDEFFKRLVAFAQDLNQEEKRSLAEGLSEEELAVLDLLTQPKLKLSQREEAQVKKVAQQLLETLKKEKLVLDWRKRQQSRGAVRLAIEQALDGLPRAYTSGLYRRECELTYQHVYESYYGAGQSVYARA